MGTILAETVDGDYAVELVCPACAELLGTPSLPGAVPCRICGAPYCGACGAELWLCAGHPDWDPALDAPIPPTQEQRLACLGRQVDSACPDVNFTQQRRRRRVACAEAGL